MKLLIKLHQTPLRALLHRQSNKTNLNYFQLERNSCASFPLRKNKLLLLLFEKMSSDTKQQIEDLFQMGFIQVC